VTVIMPPFNLPSAGLAARRARSVVASPFKITENPS
jgi:hypothetical protein